MRRTTIFLTLPVLLMSVLLALGQANTPADTAPPLWISVGGQSCQLSLAEGDAATPEATAEAEAMPEATSEAGSEATEVVAYPVLTPGVNCTNVIPLLHVPSNDTLWLALWMPNEFPWQHFRSVEGDQHPPKIDTRGRFLGCSNPERGEQSCQVLWRHEGATYRVVLPLHVGNAYTASTTTEATATPETASSGVWGNCGSCTTCGGPVEHCVLSPDNQCLWDAYRCERPNPPTSVPPT